MGIIADLNFSSDAFREHSIFGFSEFPVVDFSYNKRLDKMMHDEDVNARVEDVSTESETSHSESDEKEAMTKITYMKGGEEAEGISSEEFDASVEVNMEASITPDDVIRAGGFGARDDISSFLPVASDSADFEASIRDARDYEEPQGKVSRPGLGWNESTRKGE